MYVRQSCPPISGPFHTSHPSIQRKQILEEGRDIFAKVLERLKVLITTAELATATYLQKATKKRGLGKKTNIQRPYKSGMGLNSNS